MSRSPSDMKIKAIKDFPPPTTKTQVISYLGIVGYYAHYIPNYSEIASLLTDALKGKIKRESITWDERCEKGFAELKGKLTTHLEPRILDYPTTKSQLLQLVTKYEERHTGRETPGPINNIGRRDAHRRLPARRRHENWWNAGGRMTRK
ncbi:retrovirus-related Pol polyprotein from transposon 17.6 [Trichonephila inaurata madagascariensis]|uniref:RNA-directed DNA polymerase n=1 Tax=Trichonephila inaurata madagascariensis TaxID=2747483 RepID=A0A8X6M939_9ARAC|nr:retrovirus-related Pol polyprotein from transposon 17.6 [Trichonephila inaurata madagascariensis]